MSLFNSIQSAELIFNIGYQSLLVLSLGGVIIRLFRSKSAPFRSAVVLVTMAVLFFIPILNVSAPLFKTKTVGPTLFVKPSSSQTSLQTLPPRPFFETQPIPFVQNSSISSDDKENTGVYPVQFPRFWIHGINLFGFLWLSGSLFFLIRFFFGVFSLRKFKKNMAPVESSTVEDALQDARSVFSLKKNIPVFTTPNVLSPVALGILKPFILLPRSSLEKMRPSQMTGILIHELSHIYHQDLLIGVFQRLMTILLWWNPLSFNLSKALSRAREEISDNCVLLRNTSKEYAECLVDLAERGNFLKRLPVATAMASSHIPLKERVTFILSKERNMETRLKKSSFWALVLTAGLCLIFISGTRTTFAAYTSEEFPSAKQDKPVVQQDIQAVKQEQKEEKPVKATQDITPPKLIKKVDPVYPEIAKQAGVQGDVVIEVTTDIHGKVTETKVIRSVPLLDQAAIDAIEQWIYEPFIIDGQPRPVLFTVTCRFKLDDEEKKDVVRSGVASGITGGVQGGVEGGVQGGVAGGIVGGVAGGIEDQVVIYGNFAKPKIIKKVDAIYPLDARKAGIKGEVILQVTIDEKGRVIQATPVKSIPGLDQAAIDAVKQWVYEPYIVDGEPRSVVFPVTVTFRLR